MQLHTVFGYYSPEIVTALVAVIGIGGGLILGRIVVRWFDRMIGEG